MAILSLLVLSLLCAASAAAKRKALRRLARWLVESTGSYERLPMLLYGVCSRPRFTSLLASVTPLAIRPEAGLSVLGAFLRAAWRYTPAQKIFPKPAAVAQQIGDKL